MKPSKEFSRIESRILGVLSRLDDFLLNPPNRTCSVAVPETSTNNDSQNHEPKRDRFLGNLCLEPLFSACQSGNQKDSEQDETHHMVTRVQEEIPYYSPGTSSGKQKKARSTSQPEFRSENTPATIEADQIPLAHQQLAPNGNSANCNNNIDRIPNFPELFTTTMPTFDGQLDKFELFQDLIKTSLKIYEQLTEKDKINYFHSLMHEDAL